MDASAPREASLLKFISISLLSPPATCWQSMCTRRRQPGSLAVWTVLVTRSCGSGCKSLLACVFILLQFIEGQRKQKGGRGEAHGHSVIDHTGCITSLSSFNQSASSIFCPSVKPPVYRSVSKSARSFISQPVAYILSHWY